MPEEKNPLEGMTPEQLAEIDEWTRQKVNANRRKDYAAHPERNKRWRINSSVNFLAQNGRLVIDRPPAPPWTAMQEQRILQAVAQAFEKKVGA